MHAYLQPILQLGNEGIVGDEGEEGALHGVGQRNDQQAEDRHLKHQESEDLKADCC